ncbi:hypothetical protein QQ96_23505 [Salmonella enterica subsp. enterica serovar Newport]|nr:hypothetical protein [Salmonella enterica subsp. enterica serovar Newport]
MAAADTNTNVFQTLTFEQFTRLESVGRYIGFADDLAGVIYECREYENTGDGHEDVMMKLQVVAIEALQKITSEASSELRDIIKTASGCRRE